MIPISLSTISTLFQKDLMIPLHYLKYGIFYACIYLLFSMTIHAFSNQKALTRYTFPRFLLIIYFTILLQCLLIGHLAQPYTSFQLHNLLSSSPSAKLYAYVLEMVLIFIPFGILLPCSIRFFQHPFFCIFTGGFFSAVVELLQPKLNHGVGRIDDFVLNTFGTILGYYIFYLFYRILSSLRKH